MTLSRNLTISGRVYESAPMKLMGALTARSVAIAAMDAV